MSVNQSFDHYAAVATKFVSKQANVLVDSNVLLRQGVNLKASCFKFVKISSYSDVGAQAKQTEVSDPPDSTETITDQSLFCCHVER